MSDSPIGIKVTIFGGLRLWRNGHETPIGAQRQRIVLAELICAAGKVVSIALLVDALWEQHPPASAVNQVHRIVGQLRRTLEPGLSPHSTGTTILASGTGYRIAAGHIQCDLYQLRELARKAKNLALGGDLESANQVYADALDLAQGMLFGGLNSRAETRPEFLAVEQERVATAIAAADLAIDQGSTPQILAGVTAIAASDPLNELLHARLIKLLDVAGRRAEALTAFDALRRRLADELGIDPGRELTDAYNDLLTADTTDARLRSPAASQPLRPAQLPRAVPGFVQRADADALLADDPAVVGGTVVITAFAGMGGIGKTALAVHWAHQVADQYPDGQLYINLRGFDPGGRASTPDEALNTLLEGMGQPVGNLTELNTESRAAKYRSVMSDRRMIVVLDNARDSEQVRPLLPGSDSCLVIVTSRNRLTSMVAREGARSIPLGRLSRLEAVELLTNRLGHRRLADDPEAVDQIIERCAGLPIALSIVAARVATNPHVSMSQVVSRLFTHEAGLDGFSTGDGHDDVRTVFSWSYETLSPEGARLFRLLGAPPGPDVTVGLVASLLGIGLAGARTLTAELVNAHLLTESAADRFVIHDLLRVYAGELLDGGPERQTAEQRVVEHYLLATRAAYDAYGRPPIADLGHVSLHLWTDPCPDVAHALRWYVNERASLEAVVDLALATHMTRAAVLMTLDRRPMNMSLDPRADSLTQCLRVLDAVKKGQPEGKLETTLIAEMTRDVAGRYAASSRPQNSVMAERYFDEALALFEQLGDFGGQANTNRSLYVMAAGRGEHDLALRRTQEAVRFARLSKRPDLIALALYFMADALNEVDQYEEAATVGREALKAVRAANMPYALPVAFATLALSLAKMGEFMEAHHLAESALTTLQSEPDAEVEYIALAVAARTSAAMGLIPQAKTCVDRFHRLFDEQRGILKMVDHARARLEDLVEEASAEISRHAGA